MNVIGVVGEFNPFHLGHFQHFVQSREQLGEDAPIVCVMSGDFVQRGGPAVFDKHARAETAAKCGADLVFELPLPWCISSAERFSMGGVGLLNRLGFVTHLSFGSESGDLAPLTALALAASEEETIERIKDRMAAWGMSFAAAREMVLHEIVGEEARLLETPNNVLGVEYLKALFALRSDMIPVTTARTQTQHDMESTGPMRSASQLRSMMEAGEDISGYVPEDARAMPREQTAMGRGPVTMASLEEALISRLRMLDRAAFDALPDATEGLENRLYKAVRTEESIEAILSAVKTKRYPLSRLRRMVMCAALGVRADTGGAVPGYARLLASTERGRALLRRAGDIPVITKPAAVRGLPPADLEIFQLTADARDLYVLAFDVISERKGGSDWRMSPAVLP